MKSGDIFQSNYLKKEDVPQPIRLTIARVEAEMIAADDGKEKKAVAHWSNSNLKPMIVNKGNWITLADAYGDESDGWVGKPVEIYVDPSVMFGGKRVGGLRLRIPANAPVGWSFEEALAQAQHVGLTKEFVLSGLREKGINAWNKERCTPIVQDMIRAATVQTPGDESFGGANEEIPF